MWTKENLTTRIEQLTTEHADLWRKISMSPEWRKLQAVEAQIDLLRELIAQLAGEPSNLSGENL